MAAPDGPRYAGLWDGPYTVSETRVLCVAAVALVDRFVDGIQEARAREDFLAADKVRALLADLSIEVRFAADGSAEWFVRDPNPAATKRFRSWLASQWAEADRRAYPPRKEPGTNDQ